MVGRLSRRRRPEAEAGHGSLAAVGVGVVGRRSRLGACLYSHMLEVVLPPPS